MDTLRWFQCPFQLAGAYGTFCIFFPYLLSWLLSLFQCPGLKCASLSFTLSRNILHQFQFLGSFKDIFKMYWIFKVFYPNSQLQENKILFSKTASYYLNLCFSSKNTNQFLCPFSNVLMQISTDSSIECKV